MSDNVRTRLGIVMTGLALVGSLVALAPAGGAVAAAACATPAAYAAVHQGMTKSRVESALGAGRGTELDGYAGGFAEVYRGCSAGHYVVVDYTQTPGKAAHEAAKSQKSNGDPSRLTWTGWGPGAPGSMVGGAAVALRRKSARCGAVRYVAGLPTGVMVSDALHSGPAINAVSLRNPRIGGPMGLRTGMSVARMRAKVAAAHRSLRAVHQGGGASGFSVRGPDGFQLYIGFYGRSKIQSLVLVLGQQPQALVLTRSYC